ncbi:MAG: hypothetical protein P8M65_04235 [Roseibacillus sp.]|nr:hypothetical protein [Roseibacillus sp.]
MDEPRILRDTPSLITARNEGASTGEEMARNVSSEAVNSCGCERCSVTRWYPPMMLASTALTAVLFWMYITKPVFSPLPGVAPLGPEPAPQSLEQPREAEAESYITSRNNLDPAALKLPGETHSQPEISDQEIVSGDELRPLIIKRNGSSLFRRFLPRASPDRASEDAVPGEIESEAGSNGREERADVSRWEGVSSESDLGKAGDPDSGDLHVHASVMGEFLVSKRPEETNHGIER